MFCAKCGRVLTGNENFCVACGAAQKQSSAQGANTHYPPANTHASTGTTSAPQNMAASQAPAQYSQAWSPQHPSNTSPSMAYSTPQQGPIVPEPPYGGLSFSGTAATKPMAGFFTKAIAVFKAHTAISIVSVVTAVVVAATVILPKFSSGENLDNLDQRQNGAAGSIIPIGYLNSLNVTNNPNYFLNGTYVRDDGQAEFHLYHTVSDKQFEYSLIAKKSAYGNAYIADGVAIADEPPYATCNNGLTFESRNADMIYILPDSTWKSNNPNSASPEGLYRKWTKKHVNLAVHPEDDGAVDMLDLLPKDLTKLQNITDCEWPPPHIVPDPPSSYIDWGILDDLDESIDEEKPDLKNPEAKPNDTPQNNGNDKKGPSGKDMLGGTTGPRKYTDTPEETTKSLVNKQFVRFVGYVEPMYQYICDHKFYVKKFVEVGRADAFDSGDRTAMATAYRDFGLTGTYIGEKIRAEMTVEFNPETGECVYITFYSHNGKDYISSQAVTLPSGEIYTPKLHLNYIEFEYDATKGPQGAALGANHNIEFSYDDANAELRFSTVSPPKATDERNFGFEFFFNTLNDGTLTVDGMIGETDRLTARAFLFVHMEEVLSS